MTWNELQEYLDYNRELLATTQAALKAGKTVSEIAAAYKYPAKYRGYTIRYPVANYVQAVYDEMKK